MDRIYKFDIDYGAVQSDYWPIQGGSFELYYKGRVSMSDSFSDCLNLAIL